MTPTADTPLGAPPADLALLTDAFRDPSYAATLVRSITDSASRLGEVKLMEVCGSHTVAIFRSGIRDLLPSNVHLISGPGCPVCVTAVDDVDAALSIARVPGVIFTTFGDMLRVPGNFSSLQQARSEGADIRVVYSPLDALAIARANPDSQVVFFGAGFETTAPTIAATLLQAATGTGNFSVYSVHKTIPQAMAALLSAPDLALDGFICPGHVSVVIGERAYDFIADDFARPAVISGFEPVDILLAIDLLLKQLTEGRAEVENAYARTVHESGNSRAREILDQVFEAEDAEWRGIGVIPGSGLGIRPGLASHDAKVIFAEAIENGRAAVDEVLSELGSSRDLRSAACECGDILLGKKTPPECRLFATACTPERPMGACMVSSEGSCSAYFKYGRR